LFINTPLFGRFFHKTAHTKHCIFCCQHNRPANTFAFGTFGGTSSLSLLDTNGNDKERGHARTRWRAYTYQGEAPWRATLLLVPTAAGDVRATARHRSAPGFDFGFEM